MYAFIYFIYFLFTQPLTVPGQHIKKVYGQFGFHADLKGT